MAERSSHRKHDEYQYLELVRDIMERGDRKMDRTGTGTVGLAGASMRFSLENGVLPLLTTKRVPFKMVLEELLFFIRGQTDNKVLRDKNIHIWDGNSTKEFFEKNGIDRAADDLGPVYGFQWRHCGARYRTCGDSYDGEGIDQLAGVIEALRTHPESRRHVVVAWNPTDLPQMALPPCHCLFQFVVNNGKLTTILYQRSGDMGLGIPFNIASYSILAAIVARLAGLELKEFVHFIGDAHVYLDHLEPLTEQLGREPRSFPTLSFREKQYTRLEDFEYDDFLLDGYDPHPKIAMKMSV
ncbi:thymidylate synthase [Pancytospora philotis]|nr:thymidylate synthase [Pancytospora philotis]